MGCSSQPFMGQRVTSFRSLFKMRLCTCVKLYWLIYICLIHPNSFYLLPISTYKNPEESDNFAPIFSSQLSKPRSKTWVGMLWQSHHPPTPLSICKSNMSLGCTLIILKPNCINTPSLTVRNSEKHEEVCKLKYNNLFFKMGFTHKSANCLKPG